MTVFNTDPPHDYLRFLCQNQDKQRLNPPRFVQDKLLNQYMPMA